MAAALATGCAPPAYLTQSDAGEAHTMGVALREIDYYEGGEE